MQLLNFLSDSNFLFFEIHRTEFSSNHGRNARKVFYRKSCARMFFFPFNPQGYVRFEINIFCALLSILKPFASTWFELRSGNHLSKARTKSLDVVRTEMWNCQHMSTCADISLSQTRYPRTTILTPPTTAKRNTTVPSLQTAKRVAGQYQKIRPSSTIPDGVRTFRSRNFGPKPTRSRKLGTPRLQF